MSSLMAHCVAAYHAMRAFMAMKTPAITRTAATPARLLCLAREITANWAAMARASPKFAIARCCAASIFPAGSAATASHKWSSTSCRTRRDSDRSKLSSRASSSR
jgi:hypothetical protein